MLEIEESSEYNLLLTSGSSSPNSHSSESVEVFEFCVPNNDSRVTLSSIPLSSSPTPSSNNSLVKNNKVNRKRKIEDNPRAQFYLPRIPRRDIRRQYAIMFANAYNSHDYNFIKEFSDAFFHPDLVILFRKNLSDFHYKEAECRGIETGLSMWFSSFADVPDMVISLQKTQIKVRSDGTAVISSSFHLTGTAVKNEVWDDVDQRGNKHSFHHRSEIKQIDPKRKCQIEELLGTAPPKPSAFEKEFEKALDEYLNEGERIDQIPDSKNTFPCHPQHTTLQSNVQTFPFLVEGCFSFHLDADMRIYYCQYVLLNKTAYKPGKEKMPYITMN